MVYSIPAFDTNDDPCQAGTALRSQAGVAPDPVNRMLIRVRGLDVEKPYGVSRLQTRHTEAKRTSTTADGSSHQASMPRRVKTNVRASAATTPAATRQSSPIMNSYQNRKNPAM